jgi:hypothetical protein
MSGVAAALLLFAGQDPSGAEVLDRTSKFSAEYRQCDARAQANVQTSWCLADELERQRIKLRTAVREQEEFAEPADVAQLRASQAVWERLVKQDCLAEMQMGGSAAGLRATACEIGLVMQRTEYIRFRGAW